MLVNKIHTIQDKDEHGKSLHVSEHLDAEEHVVAKKAVYMRAIAAWNHLDTSRRRRITMPVSVQLPSQGDSQQSSGSGKDAETTNPLSLAEKWEDDALYDGL